MSWNNYIFETLRSRELGTTVAPLPQHNFKSKKIKEETYINITYRRKGMVRPVAHKSAIVDEVDGGV